MNSNELSLPMNISLDENITDTAIEHLAKYGHNVKSLRLAGISYSDDDVIKTVIKSNSVLITHNGKDFIDSIPPRRSEERRVGKECRYGRSRDQYRQIDENYGEDTICRHKRHV